MEVGHSLGGRDDDLTPGFRQCATMSTNPAVPPRLDPKMIRMRARSHCVAADLAPGWCDTLAGSDSGCRVLTGARCVRRCHGLIVPGGEVNGPGPLVPSEGKILPFSFTHTGRCPQVVGWTMWSSTAFGPQIAFTKPTL